MDLLYSYTLLISVILGGVSVLIGGIAMLGHGSGRNLVRLGLSAVAFAVLSLATSVAVHRHWGHGPTSAEPMGFARFAGSHAGFLVASVIIGLGVILMLYARRRGHAA